ncbi:MAG: FHA domain-containing protein [Acidimicrobiales bacterium]|nr:FHA domain-containing protein [Acidimicrobiales bacterium]
MAELDFHHLFEETTFRAPAPSEAEVEVPNAPDGAGTVDGATSDDEHVTRVFDAEEPPAPPEPVQPPEAAGPAPPAPEPPNHAGAGALIDWVPGGSRGAPPPPPSPPPTVLEPTQFIQPPPGRTPPVDLSHLPPPPDTAPMGSPPIEPPTTVPMAESGGDDDALEEATITVAALRAAREAAATTDPTSTVAALRCPAGHPNPTHADSCRSCGQTIADRTPQTIARPTLGRLRLPDGTFAPLDRHLLVGRSPATDIAVRDEPTGTVRLADPDKVLSRTHAAIVLDGWQVLVVDRDSMNHTYVQIPGRDPFQLRPGEPCPVPPGTAIRLGDEIEVVFEAEAP